VIIVVVKSTGYFATAIICIAVIFNSVIFFTGSVKNNPNITSSSMATLTDPKGTISSINSGQATSIEAPANNPVNPNDPSFARQWALTEMHISHLWSITQVSKSIKIAILDTGIDANHEDLKDKIVAEANFTESPTESDIYGHGTHIAGIICAISNNGIGVTGLVSDCQILNVKVADDYGFCDEEAVARGIKWAVENGANIINISLEIRNPSLELENAVNYAWEQGVLIVAAAGNQGNNFVTYPAYYENSLAVAAVKRDNNLAPLSNSGDWVDVAAPGFNIYSTLPGNKYGYESGTSFAAAYVSGIAALLSQSISDTDGDGRLNDEIRSAIETSCRPLSCPGYTFGIFDADSYIQKCDLANFK
jgi:thermitase